MRIKTKELTWRQQILEALPTLATQLIFDSKVQGGCSRRRPDALIDLLSHSIVLECDEFGHTGYSCENKRTMEIFEDLGSRPLVVLRFNPDKAQYASRFRAFLDQLEVSMVEVPEREVTELTF